MTSSTEIQAKAREVMAEIHKTGLYMDAVEVLTLALSTAHGEGFEEGMKRAAEIAREHIFSASQRGLVDDEFDGGNRRAEEIAAAILSEAEGG